MAQVCVGFKLDRTHSDPMSFASRCFWRENSRVHCLMWLVGLPPQYSFILPANSLNLKWLSMLTMVACVNTCLCTRSGKGERGIEWLPVFSSCLVV